MSYNHITLVLPWQDSHSQNVTQTLRFHRPHRLTEQSPWKPHRGNHQHVTAKTGEKL
jgi:hypothetical protein